MGKDFRIGLIAGLILAGAAVLWVATRPSLSPQAAEARVPNPRQPAEPAAFLQLVGTGSDSSPQNPDAKGLPADGGVVATAIAGTTEPQRVPPSAVDGTTQMSPPAPLPAPVGAPGMRDLTVYESAQPIKTTKFHIVRKGETLSYIAQQYYGSKEQWRKIVAANAKTIKDANKIAPGTKLILPD